MQTREQIDAIEVKATKIRIFSADYQKYELWSTGEVLALCATIRELREVLDHVVAERDANNIGVLEQEIEDARK